MSDKTVQIIDPTSDKSCALPLVSGFTLSQLRAAMVGHVLAQAQLIATYSLNRALRM